jgi:hypothetical protein
VPVQPALEIPTVPPPVKGSNVNLTDLAATYDTLSHPWRPEQLAGVYHAAYQRGASDIDPSEQGNETLTLLTTSIPRLITLAVATYAIHVLPRRAGGRQATLDDQLLETIDQAATGALHRCDRALAAESLRHGNSAQDWLALTYDIAADALKRGSLRDEPPLVVECAQEAGRWAAIAVELAVLKPAEAPEALTDTLGRLLVVCAFVDAARSHRARE